MGLDYVFDDGKSESCTTHVPASGFVHTVEAFKEAGHVFLLDAATMVGHADDDFRVNLSGLDLDRATFIAILDRIVKEINNGLLKERRIYLGYQGFAAQKVDLDAF